MAVQESASSDPVPGTARYGHLDAEQDPEQSQLVRVSYVIARLDRAIRRGIEERLAPHGLSVAQYTALSVLRNRPGLSNAQLARRTFVSPQAMNEVVASLEESKLIVRSVDPHHRRILRARLTTRGNRLFERIDPEIGDLEEQMLAGLSEAEREQFAGAAVSCVHMLGAGLPEN